MATRATAHFQIKSWDEAPYQESEGEGKLTRASVTSVYHGDIEGDGMLVYLLAYPQASDASFVGLERIVGTLGGRSGSFVLQHSGTADANNVIKGSFFVVPGSGSGDLAGLRGSGSMLLEGQAESYPLTLDYSFDDEA